METNQQAEVAETSPQPEVSIEDRILAHIEGTSQEQPAAEEVPLEEATEEGEQPAEEQEAEAEPTESEEEYVEVELNGETYQVPKELSEGYLRQQDYTRKTQELAAERQTIQEQRQAVEAERQAFQNQVLAQQQTFQIHAQISGIDAQIAQYQNLDWQQLIENDPVEYMKLERGLNTLKEKRNTLVQDAIQQQQHLSIQQQQEFQQKAELGRQELLKRIPNFSKETATALREYGVKQGYTEQELSTLIDPRVVETLYKAYQYDQLQASKPETLKKVSNAPKVIKAGAQKPKQTQAQVLKKIISTTKDKSSKHQAIQKYLETKF